MDLSSDFQCDAVFGSMGENKHESGQVFGTVKIGSMLGQLFASNQLSLPVAIDGIRYRMLDSELIFEVYSSWSTWDSKDEL
ncbi:hypothetical protein AAC387_Pa05g2095 [Persea americana]